MIPESVSSLIGQPTSNLVNAVIVTILQILTAASKQIIEQGLVKANWHENRMTNQLREKMVEAKVEKEKQLGAELMLRILPTQFGVFHTDAGVIDIAIIYSYREDEYFAIECKKLSGKRRGLDKKYVTEGMMRFVTGKYSPNHQWGMMVGYVIEGHCENAIQFVSEKIDKKHRNSLRIDKEFAKETRFGNYPFLHSTRHRQQITSTIITILHYFFDTLPASN